MALSGFAAGPGGNISVGPTPLAVQVVGPTILITNLGEATVYGTLQTGTGGVLAWQPIASIAGGGNSGAGIGGFAIPPNSSLPITTGANTWVWLATGGNVGAGVNLINGT